MGKALTVLAVEKIKPGSARREIPDGETGLYLIVQPSGARSWAVRYRSSGKPRKYTIGKYPKISVADARDLARKALVAVAEDRDPSAERKAKKAIEKAASASDSHERDFENVAAAYIERYAKENTRKATWKEIKRVLDKDVIPVWRGKTIDEITRNDVRDLLDRIVDRGAPIAANRTLEAVRRTFSWAIDRRMLESSPCAGVKPPSKERSRDRVLSDDELKAIWSAAEADGWPFGRLVQLLILTGQTRDEIAEGTWPEIDLDKRTWTLARERVKNDKAFEIPLSDQAIAVLAHLPRITGKPFVLTTNGKSSISGFSRAKYRLDALVLAALRKAAANRGDDPAAVEAPARWTLHDLRRTVASNMARLGINLPVIEKCLNHTSGSFAGIVGVYQRYGFADEKRKAFEAWGGFVERLIRGEPADNVVALRSGGGRK